MKLFRQGYYEYDKRKIAPTKKCGGCGCDIATRGGKKYCSPCYDRRYQENLAKNRHKYRNAKAEAADAPF